MMEAAIFGALVSSTLPFILQRIEEKVKDQPVNLTKDVKTIQDELIFIQHIVQDYRGRGNGISNLRRAWIAQLRRLAYDIEDCMDRFEHQGVKTTATHKKFGDEIRTLKERAESTRTRLENYTREEPTKIPDGGASSSNSGAPREDWSIPPANHPVVGMQKPLEQLRELVRESELPSERELKVISIVGFGGLGKTFLAKQFYWECAKDNLFPLRAGVTAAGKSREEVLKEIIGQLLNQVKNAEHAANTYKNTQSEEVLKEILYQLLNQVGNSEHTAGTSKSTPQVRNGEHGAGTSNNTPQVGNLVSRYLIVIDDVRTEELRTILSAFPQAMGVDSRIIVTTTIQSLAESWSSHNGHIYKMSTLNGEDSQKLFFQVASKKEASDAVKLESSAVLEICDGLPLALVSIAQFLIGKSLTAEICNAACSRLCARPEENSRLARVLDEENSRLARVLVDSYDSLPSHVLQDCLLYFSMFPRGHHARRDSLIRRWLAEGLVQRDVACSDQDVALRNFATLIDRNIIQPIQGSNNANLKRCRPPGTMLKYISYESIFENFMLSCDRTPQAKYIRRLSLHHYDGERIAGSKFQHLRTLAVFPSQYAMYLQLNLEDYKLLRVLDLEECDPLKNSHLEDICDLLLLLKYLSLGGRISKVPRKIARLKRLETLDLRRTKVKTVPVQVIELPELKHLLGKFRLVRFDFIRRGLEKKLSKECNLETLAGFLIGKSRGFPELIIHMRRLRKVKIWCKPTADRENLDRLSKSIREFIRKGTDKLAGDRSLSIDFNECPIPFLESMAAPGSLTSLKLSGKLSQFPLFVSRLTCIMELCLSQTTLTGDLILVGLKNLRMLKYLKLVEDNLGDHLVILPNLLRSLERICLVGEQGLPQITIQERALPCLVSLHLLCQSLGLSVFGIEHLKCLKEVALHSGVAQDTKDTWKNAARDHPNRPNVLYI